MRPYKTKRQKFETFTSLKTWWIIIIKGLCRILPETSTGSTFSWPRDISKQSRDKKEHANVQKSRDHSNKTFPKSKQHPLTSHSIFKQQESESTTQDKNNNLICTRQLHKDQEIVFQGFLEKNTVNKGRLWKIQTHQSLLPNSISWKNLKTLEMS
jgi:Mg2+ and Co2+ transporter CorA